jgi:hypothetical protein
MRASVERVHAGALQSVKERIENAKTDPKTKIDELVKEQAEIANEIPGVIMTGIPVIHLPCDRVRRIGAWYEVVDANHQELTITPKHPFYFKRDSFYGIGLVIIKLCEQVLGYDETLLIRFENRTGDLYDDLLLPVSKKLSEIGYDSVVFYETEPLLIREVYLISIGHSETAK